MAKRGLPLVVAVVASCVLALSGSAGAVSAGALDPSFGVGGVVITHFDPDTYNETNAVARVVVQPDGRIVALGSKNRGALLLARYLRNGSLDQSFGAGGKVTVSASLGTASALALAPDGKIVVGLPRLDYSTQQYVGDLVRYLPNGELDQSFGTAGSASLLWPGNSRAIVVLPDGRTIVAGVAYNGQFFSNPSFMVMRLTPSGAPDPTFGLSGRVVTDLGGDAEAIALLLLPDGKMIAVGSVWSNAPTQRVVLVRYLPDGSPDRTFGSGGKVVTDVGDVRADDAFLTADGKIVVVAGSPALVLGRFLPDGSLDPSFGRGGIAAPAVAVDPLTSFDAAMQPDGKVVVVNGRFAATRLTAEGALDGGFGIGGIADAGITGFGRTIALEPSGNVIVAGGTGTSPSDFELVRFLGDPVAPPSPPAPPGGGGSGAADLYLTGSAEPASAPVGATITWRLRVLDDKNYGAATGVYVDVTLPAGVTLVSARADRGQGCVSTGGRKLRCSLDWLSSDAPSANITLVSNVTTAGELVLTATVGYSATDPNQANNILTLKANTPATVAPAPLKPPVAVRPVLGTPVTKPARPLAGRQFTLTLPVNRSDKRKPLTFGRMAGDVALLGKAIKHAESFKGGKARLSFVVPKTAKGRQLRITITFTASGQFASRAFTYKVR